LKLIPSVPKSIACGNISAKCAKGLEINMHHPKLHKSDTAKHGLMSDIKRLLRKKQMAYN
jgi:hypothetical protein